MIIGFSKYGTGSGKKPLITASMNQDQAENTTRRRFFGATPNTPQN